MNNVIWVNDLITSGRLVMINGGIQIMTNNNTTTNNVSGVKNSAFTFGANSPATVTNNNSEVVDLTKELIYLLKTENISDESKEELEGYISSAAEEASSEKPKKPILKSLLGSANSIMDTITKSPALIAAYDKWATFIQGLTS
jgi:hypothetical protein